MRILSGRNGLCHPAGGWSFNSRFGSGRNEGRRKRESRALGLGAFDASGFARIARTAASAVTGVKSPVEFLQHGSETIRPLKEWPRLALPRLALPSLRLDRARSR